jgi:type IV secretory pathway VirB2 component (pilin)
MKSIGLTLIAASLVIAASGKDASNTDTADNAMEKMQHAISGAVNKM